jgi:Zn-dependent protease
MSLAGPAANLLLIIIAGILIHAGIAGGIFLPPPLLDNNPPVVLATSSGFSLWAALVVTIMFTLNLILLVFNLIPVPPLDGTAIGEFIFKGETLYKYRMIMSNPNLRMFGILIAWVIMRSIFDPVFTFAVNALYFWRGAA